MAGRRREEGGSKDEGQARRKSVKEVGRKRKGNRIYTLLYLYFILFI